MGPILGAFRPWGPAGDDEPGGDQQPAGELDGAQRLREQHDGQQRRDEGLEVDGERRAPVPTGETRLESVP